MFFIKIDLCYLKIQKASLQGDISETYLQENNKKAST